MPAASSLETAASPCVKSGNRKANPREPGPKPYLKSITPELGKLIARVSNYVRKVASRLNPEAPVFHPRRPPSPPWATIPRDPPYTPWARSSATPTVTSNGTASSSGPYLAYKRPPDPSGSNERTIDEELKALVAEATQRYRASKSWEEFFDRQRDPTGDWGPVETINHPASHLLQHYRNHGVPAKVKTRPWSKGKKEAALARGPHKSAKEHLHFLKEEYIDMIKKGHWVLLPAAELLDVPELRLSPLGVVPQRDRRPRTISDYSYFGVNDETVPLAPQEAMQFGRALQRLLQRIADANPAFGPVYMAKIDIADGFYRIGIRPGDAAKLAVLFPTGPGEEQLIGIPLTLPMGWTESPPAFCTATETAADLANEALRRDPQGRLQRPHRLDELAESPIPDENVESKEKVEGEKLGTRKNSSKSRTALLASARPSKGSSDKPVKSRTAFLASERINRGSSETRTTIQAHIKNTEENFKSQDRRERKLRQRLAHPFVATPSNPNKTNYNLGKLHKPVRQWDLYVDDYLGQCQGGKRVRKGVKRALMHSLDKIFRPLSPDDNPHRQEPASIKKLKKGDATWSTRKTMLGWIIDSVKSTISLPAHRVERLQAILDAIAPNQRYVPTKQWHKVLGELRSMAIAIPGARGLFSLLQEAFRHEEKGRNRLRLSRAVHEVLDDFRWMARDVSIRPTRIAEIVPKTPTVVGACDAAGPGMGGVFFAPSPRGIQPFLWRAPFPEKVQQNLVSFDNPTGSITNSDLELCGNIAQHDVVVQAVDVREQTIWTASDNTANVYWQRKGSTTTTGPAAYLLRAQALHQRYHRYLPTHDYIPGPANEMADLCSRAWNLDDSQLLQLFNSKFPQALPWKECHLDSEMFSALISALFKKPSSMAYALKNPEKPINTGGYGPPTAWNTASTRSYAVSQIRSPFCKSLPTVTDKELLLPAKNWSDIVQYRQPCVRWARRSNGWGPRTHGSRL